MAKTKRPSSAASTGPGRIQLLVDSVIDYAIYMLDLEGRVESWNAGAARLKGYSLDEILGQHFSRFYTPEDRAAGVPAFALKTARETGRFHAEGWRVRKDGTRFWASVVIDPIRNDKGELIGYAKVTRDMTDQRTAIQALLESEAPLPAAHRSSRRLRHFPARREGYVATWNPGARRIKGYSQEEIVGQHFSRFYTEEDRAKDVPQLALQQAETAGKFEAEGWRVRKDGSTFWALIVIDPIRDEAGNSSASPRSRVTSASVRKRNASCGRRRHSLPRHRRWRRSAS